MGAVTNDPLGLATVDAEQLPPRRSSLYSNAGPDYEEQDLSSFNLARKSSLVPRPDHRAEEDKVVFLDPYQPDESKDDQAHPSREAERRQRLSRKRVSFVELDDQLD